MATDSFVQYLERRAPRWAALPSAIEDQLNQLMVLLRVRRTVGVFSSDPRIRDAVRSAVVTSGEDSVWADLVLVCRAALNAAFVNGEARTLWLSGTHGRSSVKADAKILAGLDLRDALDPLEDQSFYFTAARSRPDGSGFVVGAPPRKSAVWVGPATDWADFRDTFRLWRIDCAPCRRRS